MSLSDIPPPGGTPGRTVLPFARTSGTSDVDVRARNAAAFAGHLHRADVSRADVSDDVAVLPDGEGDLASAAGAEPTARAAVAPTTTPATGTTTGAGDHGASDEEAEAVVATGPDPRGVPRGGEAEEEVLDVVTTSVSEVAGSESIAASGVSSVHRRGESPDAGTTEPRPTTSTSATDEPARRVVSTTGPAIDPDADEHPTREGAEVAEPGPFGSPGTERSPDVVGTATPVGSAAAVDPVRGGDAAPLSPGDPHAGADAAERVRTTNTVVGDAPDAAVTDEPAPVALAADTRAPRRAEAAPPNGADDGESATAARPGDAPETLRRSVDGTLSPPPAGGVGRVQALDTAEVDTLATTGGDRLSARDGAVASRPTVEAGRGDVVELPPAHAVPRTPLQPPVDGARVAVASPASVGTVVRPDGDGSARSRIDGAATPRTAPFGAPPGDVPGGDARPPEAVLDTGDTETHATRRRKLAMDAASEATTVAVRRLATADGQVSRVDRPDGIPASGVSGGASFDVAPPVQIGGSGTPGVQNVAPGHVVGTPLVLRGDTFSAPLAIAPQSVPLDGSAAGAGELAAGVRWTLGEGRGQALINVTPAGLGPVNIRVSVETDQVSVSIVATQFGAREALESLIPRLREQLAADGHDSVRVDVSDGQGDRSGADSLAGGYTRDRSGTGRATEEDRSVPGSDDSIGLGTGSLDAHRAGTSSGRTLIDAWA